MKKILVIEDDVTISELIRDYLEINGYEAVLAGRGDEGVEYAKDADIALVILDIMLPVMDGFEVCRQIRKFSFMPIIFLSAKSDDIDKIRGLGLGADDYVSKPFSPGELVARVNAHIAAYERLVSTGNARNDVIEIRGLSIDKADRRVYVNGEEVFLTTKELDLLLFFMENPNHVFNRDTLFDRVWGMDSFGDGSTVTVHIKKIRKKIEANDECPQYIETVWGSGYRMRV